MKWLKYVAIGLLIPLMVIGLSPRGVSQEGPAAAGSPWDGNAAPPLIERELFFSDPQIANSQLSPDGDWLAFQRPLDGVMNVWVKGLDDDFDAAQPITADTQSPILNYAWSRDGQSMLYIQDRDGDENFRLYAVDPAAALAEAGLEVATLDLTPFDGVQARIYARPKQTPNQIIVGLNDRDPALHDVTAWISPRASCLRPRSGPPRCLPPGYHHRRAAVA